MEEPKEEAESSDGTAEEASEESPKAGPSEAVSSAQPSEQADPSRRTFLAKAGGAAMATGLVASYGSFGLMAARYLYPAKPTPKAWLFVADLASFAQGSSLVYRSPSGAPVVVARNGNSGTEADFIALSSTCPHLGCQVHWEAQNKRFFCPCHNGAFDPGGIALAGPPKDAGQSLPRYPLKVEKGLLYIEVPISEPS